MLADRDKSVFHSHPGGYDRFSETDDAFDAELFDAIDLRAPGLHASVVMLPDGSMFGRRFEAGQSRGPLDRVAVVDDELAFHDRVVAGAARDFDLRHRQMIGDGTTDPLARLRVGVVGASGTGSPIIEMLVRLGVGRIVIVDPDRAEHQNLNRIWESARADADALVQHGLLVSQMGRHGGVRLAREPQQVTLR